MWPIFIQDIYIYNRLAADCKFRYQVKSSYRWHYVDILPLRWSPGRADTVDIWRKVTSAAIYNELGAMKPVGHTREEQLCLTATVCYHGGESFQVAWKKKPRRRIHLHPKTGGLIMEKKKRKSCALWSSGSPSSTNLTLKIVGCSFAHFYKSSGTFLGADPR